MSGTITKEEFSVHLALWVCLLMPVPFMRVVLYDHSLQQAMYGFCLGVVSAIAWWRVVLYFQRKFADYIDKDWSFLGGRITHDLDYGKWAGEVYTVQTAQKGDSSED